MDGYNWGITRIQEKHGWTSRWRPWQEIFSPLYKELKSLSSKKPLFVFETATVSQGGEKAAWIRDACAAIQERNVQGIVWFQAKKEVFEITMVAFPGTQEREGDGTNGYPFIYPFIQKRIFYHFGKFM